MPRSFGITIMSRLSLAGYSAQERSRRDKDKYRAKCGARKLTVENPRDMDHGSFSRFAFFADWLSAR